jgi:hypothetical protein
MDSLEREAGHLRRRLAAVERALKDVTGPLAG